MGSSFHALHPLNLELVNHGLTAFMVETAELIHYASRFFDPNTLIIAVSQSGRSAEVVRLLEMNRNGSALIAITNTEDSPLAHRSDAVVLTQAGKEFSVSCKTYVTALMALRWVGDVLCEKDSRRTLRELKQAAMVVSGYLSKWEAYVQNLASELTDIGHLFLVGRGASLAAVGTGALIVKESDHFHAEGMSSAAFRHGPFEMLSRESFVLVFAGDSKTRKLNQKLLADIREQNIRAEIVGEEASLPACRLPAAASSIHPILEILPVQMITLALAAQTGREPGRFELASKVTTTE
jgi:glucosamine--fructose-6-phosphate aminotransferase (isomerizing)